MILSCTALYGLRVGRWRLASLISATLIVMMVPCPASAGEEEPLPVPARDAVPGPAPADLTAPLQADIRLAPEPIETPAARRRPAWLFTSNGAHADRLWSQTRLMLGMGLASVFVLYAMPSSITGWERGYNAGDLPSRWWERVSGGPDWDDNSWLFNYVSHPYCGGVYYVMARKSGYSQRDSFVYSALMSTFFWEYGIEAFAERPSKQDLIVTPVGGWLYGEWAYHREQAIMANGGRVWGSHMLGTFFRFWLDPIDSIGRFTNRAFGKDWVITGDVTLPALSLPAAGNEGDAREESPAVSVRLGVRF